MNAPQPGSSPPELLDILLPPEPGWWPPAWPWWLLAALLLLCALLAWGARRRHLRRQREQRRLRHQQQILHQYLALRQTPMDDPWGGLSRLLRQAAVIGGYPGALHCSPADWQAYLFATLPADEPDLRQALAEQCYRRSDPPDWQLIDRVLPQWLSDLGLELEPQALALIEEPH